MVANFHLPGMFEFAELYKCFLPLYGNHREYFYDYCNIASIYDAPIDCIWGGGRVGAEEIGDEEIDEILALLRKYGISARLTFSNSLLTENHLRDRKCNALCRKLAGDTPAGDTPNGVIVHSELLAKYLKEKYPSLYLVSSTTKVLTNFNDFVNEAGREEFEYIVPDFRLNKKFNELKNMDSRLKDKTEFLCNECCYFGCNNRRECYEAVSKKVLGMDSPEFICKMPGGNKGYSFANAMDNPGFISADDIVNKYLPMGFANFKIEGRGLGSAMILEFLLYYLIKPEYNIHVREEIYLDGMLDLF